MVTKNSQHHWHSFGNVTLKTSFQQVNRSFRNLFFPICIYSLNKRIHIHLLIWDCRIQSDILLFRAMTITQHCLRYLTIYYEERFRMSEFRCQDCACIKSCLYWLCKATNLSFLCLICIFKNDTPVHHLSVSWIPMRWSYTVSVVRSAG